ncbi:MAG: DUF4132 domain-containing protein, partial [Micrococcales bacterium]|nr:DUF4132 domain-containing protein [Micrococcales bacterium]
ALQAAVEGWADGVQKSLADKGNKPWVKARLDAARSCRGRGFSAQVTSYLNGRGSAPAQINYLPDTLWQNLSLPLLAIVRLSSGRVRNQRYKVTLGVWRLSNLSRESFDLRAVAQAAAIAGVDEPIAQVSGALFSWGGLHRQRPENVWPFFAENPLRLDQALGLAPPSPDKQAWNPDEVGVALQILKMFPVLPARYVPVLAQFATGTSKVRRAAAQRLLQEQPGVLGIAMRTLDDGATEIRAAGAAWLGRIGDPTAVAGLRKALAKERREAAQAAMLSALHALGDDVSAYLSPTALTSAASKGLAGKAPADMAWFPLDALPACRWADGALVDPSTIRWWVVMADKLKDPLGAGLFRLYIPLLDEASRQALGAFVLGAWIARDVSRPSDEECRAYAASNVNGRMMMYKQWGASYASRTSQMVFDELRRERAAEYQGSAIANKGMLALSIGAAGHHIATAVQGYIRDHGHRWAQITALVTAASGSDDPAAIQLVLGIARKHTQESVRVKAAELAEGIADRLGWSAGQLADRTIPTAGFSDDGLLSLDYGPRCFTGRVARSAKTGAFTVALFNKDGKPVAALPASASTDDEALAAQSRKQLSESKKELKQIAAFQTSRLFEAMCLGRTWSLDDWRGCPLDHPVMRHLVATLVWQVIGDEPITFRPTVDGELLDVDDDAIELTTGTVRLAHRAVMAAADARLWRQHLADYQIAPLFDQFEAEVPPVVETESEVTDHAGWLSDSFAIRARATKRGYTRAKPMDGAWFSSYERLLPDAGITVVIEFTGAVLPEEQVPAAVKTLSFEQEGMAMRLGDVPKILLAESYADYVYVAQAGTYDPDWAIKATP